MSKIGYIEDYQRELKMSEVTDIVNDFSEYIANEPKLAFYDGHYYVFDGQHTIAARLVRNHNKPLDILCKVYYDLTRQQAAALFAKQTGYSRRLTPGQKIRADIFSGEKNVTVHRSGDNAWNKEKSAGGRSIWRLFPRKSDRFSTGNAPC